MQAPAQVAAPAPSLDPHGQHAPAGTSAAQTAAVMNYARMYGAELSPLVDASVVPVRPQIPSASANAAPTTRAVDLPGTPAETVPGQPDRANTASLTTGGGRGTTGALTSTTTTPSGDGSAAVASDALAATYQSGVLSVSHTQTDGTQNADGSGSSQGQGSSVGINRQHGSLVLGQNDLSAQTTVGADGQLQTATSDRGTTVELGPNNFGAGFRNQTTDADGSVNGSSGNLGFDTRTGALSGAATYTSSGTTVGGGVTLAPNQVGANASLKSGQFNIGGGFTVTAGQTTTDAHSDGPVAALLGPGYVSTVQRSQVDLSASASLRGIGVSGAMTSGSTTEAMTAASLLPKNWADLQPAERLAFQQQQEQRLATYQDGLSVEELLLLQSGEGTRTTSYNGWSLGGSVPVGGVASLSAGGGQTTAHEVTIVRGPRPTVDAAGNPVAADRLVVNIASMQGSSSELGAGIAGVGLNFGGTSSNAHQYQLEIDPEALRMGPGGQPQNPQAYEAVQLMLNTGLMPGAASLTSEGMPERYQQFQGAYQQVAPLTSQIDSLRATLGQSELPQARALEIRTQLTQLYGQLDQAQQTIETSRAALNQSWQQTYGPENQPPIPGVVIRSETSEQQSGNTLTAAGTQVASHNETWTQSQYLTRQNQQEHRFSYNEQNYFLGNLSEAFTGTSTTGVDRDAPMFAMRSDNNVLLEENANIIRNIRNRDVPDYVLDDDHARYWMRGRAEVTMNAQQFNTMTAAMNDMSNPQSQAMWQGMGARVTQYVSGDQYWLDSGNADLDANRGREMDRSRYGWLADQFNGQAGPDGQQSPITRALHEGGAQTPQQAMQAAAALFATVQSPQQFQALSPDQQQLFIALLDQTSGRDEDVTGQRSSFEALAPISLIADGATRANTMTTFMADANDEAKGDYRDGALEFIHFTDRFRDNPAVYNVIQSGISFDWTQEGAERLAGGTPQQINQELTDAYNEHSWFGLGGQDPNEGRALDALMAANMTGGPAQLREAMLASGADPVTLLNNFPEGSIERRLYLDLINQVPELKAQVDAATGTS